MVVSCDRSEDQMMAYQQLMPPDWLAIPYNSSCREQILQMFKIDSVPRALVFSPSGSLVCENAAATHLTLYDMGCWERKAAEAAIGNQSATQ